LALLSGVLLKMMLVYGASVVAAFYLNGAIGGLVSFDIGGSAMRMASLGALSTALLMLVPPLIMQFFNSGAAFAAGAMAGVMGGGAAMGAARGLVGPNGPMGLAAPEPSGPNRQIGGASAASLDGQTNTYSLPPSVRQGADGFGGGAGMPAGSRGIASHSSRGLGEVQAREREMGLAQELRLNTSTGVYETSASRVALADPASGVGTGGRLPVHGSTGGSAGAGATGSAALPSSPPSQSASALTAPTLPSSSVGGSAAAHYGGGGAFVQGGSDMRQPVSLPQGPHPRSQKQGRVSALGMNLALSTESTETIKRTKP